MYFPIHRLEATGCPNPVGEKHHHTAYTTGGRASLNSDSSSPVLSIDVSSICFWGSRFAVLQGGLPSAQTRTPDGVERGNEPPGQPLFLSDPSPKEVFVFGVSNTQIASPRPRSEALPHPTSARGGSTGHSPPVGAREGAPTNRLRLMHEREHQQSPPWVLVLGSALDEQPLIRLIPWPCAQLVVPGDRGGGSLFMRVLWSVPTGGLLLGAVLETFEAVSGGQNCIPFLLLFLRSSIMSSGCVQRASLKVALWISA